MFMVERGKSWGKLIQKALSEDLQSEEITLPYEDDVSETMKTVRSSKRDPLQSIKQETVESTGNIANKKSKICLDQFLAIHNEGSSSKDSSVSKKHNIDDDNRTIKSFWSKLSSEVSTILQDTSNNDPAKENCVVSKKVSRKPSIKRRKSNPSLDNFRSFSCTVKKSLGTDNDAEDENDPRKQYDGNRRHTSFDSFFSTSTRFISSLADEQIDDDETATAAPRGPQNNDKARRDRCFQSPKKDYYDNDDVIDMIKQSMIYKQKEMDTFVINLQDELHDMRNDIDGFHNNNHNDEEKEEEDKEETSSVRSKTDASVWDYYNSTF